MKPKPKAIHKVPSCYATGEQLDPRMSCAGLLGKSTGPGFEEAFGRLYSEEGRSGAARLPDGGTIDPEAAAQPGDKRWWEVLDGFNG